MFQGAAALAAALQGTTRLTHLSVHGNQISECSELSQALTAQTRLRQLNLADNRLSAAALHSLHPVLRECRSLEVLVLARNRLEDEQAAVALFGVLPQARNLRRLDLSGNSGLVVPAVVEALVEAATACFWLLHVDGVPGDGLRLRLRHNRELARSHRRKASVLMAAILCSQRRALLLPLELWDLIFDEFKSIL